MRREWGAWGWLAVEKIVLKVQDFLPFYFNGLFKYFFTHLFFQIRDAYINQPEPLPGKQDVVEVQAALVGRPSDMPMYKPGLMKLLQSVLENIELKLPLFHLVSAVPWDKCVP